MALISIISARRSSWESQKNCEIMLMFQLIRCVISRYFKAELSPFKKTCFYCFNESSLKVMKSTFYFILSALFVLKIFKFLSWLFWTWRILNMSFSHRYYVLFNNLALTALSKSSLSFPRKSINHAVKVVSSQLLL